MTNQQVVEQLTKMIDECYNYETGEMSHKEANRTYIDGLLDALKLIRK